MSNFNWVDITFIAIFLLSILAGFMRGFVREIISLLTLIAAFVIAIMFSNVVANYLTNLAFVKDVVNQSTTNAGVDAATPVMYVALGISFGLLFVGTLIIGAIIGYFLNAAFGLGILGIGNRILGSLFGLVRAYFINLVIIFVVQLTPLSTEPWWEHSKVVKMYQPAVVWLGKIVSPSLSNLKERFGQTMEKVGESVQNRITEMMGFKIDE